jgi:ribonuclease HI
MVDIYTLYFDGACGPKNPGGTAAYGYVLSHFGTIVDRSHAVVGTGPEMSNNVAEYAGLFNGLLGFYCQVFDPNMRAITLQVKGDSQLVINQMNGLWKAKAGLYYPWYEKTVAVCKRIRKLGVKITFDWIPREMNQECDTLSKEGWS